MDFYCIPEFEFEFNSLCLKNNYSNLPNLLFDEFNSIDINGLKSGTNLLPGKGIYYIKRRIAGSSGYRVYYVIDEKNNKVYFGFIHPKTGPEGIANIGHKFKIANFKSIFVAMKNGDLKKVKFMGHHFIIE